MKAEYKDFIGYYKDVFPDNYCQEMINWFLKLKNESAGWDRQTGEDTPKTRKDDYAINFNYHRPPPDFFADGIDRPFRDIYYYYLEKCIGDYIDQYDILKDYNRLHTTDIKGQETSSSGGYHIWHFEHAPEAHSNRVLTFIVYLNTLTPEQNGTTEFLYQQRQIQPIENTVAIWPAGFTHPHRGNPVYGEEAKYIVTGWIHCE